MNEDNFEAGVDWSKAISSREAYVPDISMAGKKEPAIDVPVSKIVGFKVSVNDPRLIKLVSKWKRKKDPNEFDKFLQDPTKVKELKKVFKNG